MKTMLVLTFMLVGVASMSQEATVVSQVTNNQYVTYDENGYLKSTVTVDDGIETVVLYSYYEDGTLSAVKCFRDSKPHGTWWTYSPTGLATAMANYDNGNKVGTWIMWDMSGSQKTALRYDENGIRVACQEYNTRGEILMAGCK